MIKGTYIFYENGKEIYRQDNIITKFGKRFLTNYIAGNGISQAKDMAFGIQRHEALITGASASNGIITYTGTNDFYQYSADEKISIYGLSTSAFNLSNVTISSGSSSQFTVVNSATGPAVTGSTTGRAYKMATENDTRLGFEFYRSPVDLGSIDIQTAGQVSSYAVIYKTTLPQDVAGVISEIGLYPSTRYSVVNYDSKFLSDFYRGIDWYSSDGYNGESSTTNVKIGDTIVNFSAISGISKEYMSSVNFDFSGYSNQDTITLAYNKIDNNLSQIRIKFYSSDDAWFYYDIIPESGTGYKISPDIYLSDLFNQYGSLSVPDRNNIVKIGIQIIPTSGQSTTVGLDGLRINDEDTFDPVFGLISRTTLATPLEKILGRQIDVEYRLDLGF